MPSTPLRILVVMTNHHRYPHRSDSTGLWLSELTHFTDLVRAAGHQTEFASPTGGAVPLDPRSLGWLHMDRSTRAHHTSPTFMAQLQDTAALADIDPSDFAAIYFTGGHGVMWDFRQQPDVQRIAETIYARGGVVSAVCHGVAGLLDLADENGQPLVQGRRLTGFSNREERLSGLREEVPFLLQDELTQRGARYQSGLLPFLPYAVADGRLITGQNPASAKAVARLVLSELSD